MLNRSRRYLNEALCAEVSRRGRRFDRPVLDVPRELASAVVAHLGLDGIRAYFAATPEETAAFLYELGPKLGGTGAQAPIYSGHEAEARSWMQQLVQL